LLLPDLAPAVNAGVRFPRAERASVRESFRAEVLRDKVPVRVDEAGFPLDDPLVLRLAHVPFGDFPLRAAPEAWPLAFAERVPAGRASEFRRGDRVVAPAWAGLRFRACWAGRLKFLRADAGVPLVEALCPFVAAVDVVSVLMAAGSTGTNGAAACERPTGSGGAGSKYESSWSLNREKYPPTDIAELA